jgi:hypothetical protein
MNRPTTGELAGWMRFPKPTDGRRDLNAEAWLAHPEVCERIATSSLEG